MLRRAFVAAALVLLTQFAGGAAALAEDVLERAFVSGGRVVMELSAGGYEVIGTGTDQIRVDWRRSDARNVDVDVTVKGREATVFIDGPLHKGAEAIIEVPRRTDLVVRLSAGELLIKGVEGHKDVSARAGEIDIQLGRPEQYRRVEASVNIGELNASAFNQNKEGFFRSVTWIGKGTYDLRARLTVGELNLAR